MPLPIVGPGPAEADGFQDATEIAENDAEAEEGGPQAEPETSRMPVVENVSDVAGGLFGR